MYRVASNNVFVTCNCKIMYVTIKYMLNYILILNQLYSILVCLWGGNRIISNMMVLKLL